MPSINKVKELLSTIFPFLSNIVAPWNYQSHIALRSLKTKSYCNLPTAKGIMDPIRYAIEIGTQSVYPST